MCMGEGSLRVSPTGDLGVCGPRLSRVPPAVLTISRTSGQADHLSDVRSLVSRRTLSCVAPSVTTVATQNRNFGTHTLHFVRLDDTSVVALFLYPAE